MLYEIIERINEWERNCYEFLSVFTLISVIVLEKVFPTIIEQEPRTTYFRFFIITADERDAEII